MMEKTQSRFLVQHIQIIIPRSFEEVTAKIEQRLGKLDPVVLSNLTPDEKTTETFFNQIRGMEGPDGFMLFNVIDHGQLLTLYGKPSQARQYVLGNPLIALEMTRQDIRAGLYAPLRLYVYAHEGKTKVEYDLPGDLLGQWGNAEVNVVAEELNQKMESLLNYVAANV